MTQAEALTILKTGASVYLTGEPGSGKSYTIGTYVTYLREHGIEPAITASTGIAATHIHGLTIHSWSGIGIKKQLSVYDVDQIASNEYVARRIGKTKVLIIDEISMLDARTLDMVDQVCRAVLQSNEPFGGIQVVLVGDFFQLPPVTHQEGETPFAFDSEAWKNLSPLICYLHEQHRQEDDSFLSFLSALRGASIGEEHHDYLTQRIYHYDDVPEDVPKLFPHNVHVDMLNDAALGKLNTDSHVYEMESEGPAALVMALTRGCLSPEKLTLKVGATVMFTKNNPPLGFANGTIGVVTGFDPYDSYPIVETRDGRTITVPPMDWIVEENGKIRARIMQVPLRLAWAMTIHKSQGMSLDAAVMDLSQSFEYGQGYVALSRVRSHKGLYLIGWNEKSLLVHPEILEKDSLFKEQSAAAEQSFKALSQAELLSMHENFILASGGVLQPKPISKPAKAIGKKKKEAGSTYEETLKLIQQGKQATAIAELRSLSYSTVLDHFEKLFDDGVISVDEVLRCFSKKDRACIPNIHKAFLALETTQLKPVFVYLDEAYTYDQLKLARIIFPDKERFLQATKAASKK